MSVNGMTAVLAWGPEIPCSRLSRPVRNLRAIGVSAREFQRSLKTISEVSGSDSRRILPKKCDGAVFFVWIQVIMGGVGGRLGGGQEYIPSDNVRSTLNNRPFSDWRRCPHMTQSGHLCTRALAREGLPFNRDCTQWHLARSTGSLHLSIWCKLLLNHNFERFFAHHAP